MRPDGERICYDPYAVHFVSPGILEWAAHCPDEVKAQKKKVGLPCSLLSNFRFLRTGPLSTIEPTTFDPGPIILQAFCARSYGARPQNPCTY